MALRIKRQKDTRARKCILHRVADIPGGVTVKTANLGGRVLMEGTPIGVGSDGLYEVCKSVKVLTEANATAVTYEVEKGHHFQVGDNFSDGKSAAKAIVKIDKSDVAKDIITLEETLEAVVAAGTIAFEASGKTKKAKVEPKAVVGSTHSVVQEDNLFTDAWVMAVVRKGNAPAITAEAEKALSCVAYV